jgi:hypothetical protein
VSERIIEAGHQGLDEHGTLEMLAVHTGKNMRMVSFRLSLPIGLEAELNRNQLRHVIGLL